ncbi:MAG: LytTR family transcriptional regulator DNA-binding domain-containing protein [Clostridia bacterium]|nr:LytTR family transcriptional regulator DNA-binding domain-containing protein [Clostridia bacterium]
MKFTFIIDDSRHEECVIYARERTPLIDEIERLVSEDGLELVGYKDSSIIKLNPSDVYCFVVDSGKTYALTDEGRLVIKNRLYQLEQVLNEGFVKINQSCIANVKKIQRFDVTFSGTLSVVFKNGYVDYVSRRQMKNVRERLGV